MLVLLQIIWSKVRLLLDRSIAGKPLRQIGIFLLFFVCVFMIVGIFYWKNDKGLAKEFVDMVSPVSAHNQAYENNPDGQSVSSLIIVYILGTIIFTGLLIATITSAIRTEADRFKQGTIKFYFRHHIVFLGYDDMIVGMIQRLCEEDEKSRIVVGVESNASDVSDKIKNRIFNKYENNVVVLKADSCNKNDLRRLRVQYAKKVFIIGEHDDAYNLKSYRSIYELSLCEKDFENKMPQCYVNLRHHSTLTLFQTYATSGDIGVDFSHFHIFNFYDEWARYMITGTGLNGDNKKWRIDRGDIENKDHKQVHLVIVGMTEMGRALARQALLLCHYPNQTTPTKITFIDPQAIQQANRFIGHYQRLFDKCRYTQYNASAEIIHPVHYAEGSDEDSLNVEFEFYEADVSDIAIRKNIEEWAKDPKQMLTIAICLPKASQSLAAGIYLPECLFQEDNENKDNEENKNNLKNEIPIWIYQPTYGDLGNYLKGPRYNNIVTFGTLGINGAELDVCKEDAIKLAMRINHHIRNGDLIANNERLIKIEWDGNSIYEKWACINQAMHILQWGNIMINNNKVVNNEIVDIFIEKEKVRRKIEGKMTSDSHNKTLSDKGIKLIIKTLK